LKVYISSHDLVEAQKLAEQLKAQGHEITSLWHMVNREEIPLTQGLVWKQRAVRNFHCIRDSDCVVLIGGNERYPGGKYVEAGYAIARDIPVYNLGEFGNGMMCFTTRVQTFEDLLKVLASN